MTKSTQPQIIAPNDQLTLLPIALLHIDSFYQRPVITRHVNNIVRGFDRRLLTPPIVAKRRDGTYWVIDGQQRIEALRRRGYTGVNAMVVEVSSTTEEAELFVRINTAAKSLVMRDNYKACVYRQTNVAMAIESALNEHGLTALLSDGRDEVTALGKLLEAWGPGTPVYQHYDLNDSDQLAQFNSGKRSLTWLVKSLSPLINRGHTARSIYHGSVVGGLLWLARAHDDIELEKVQAALQEYGYWRAALHRIAGQDVGWRQPAQPLRCAPRPLDEPAGNPVHRSHRGRVVRAAGVRPVPRPHQRSCGDPRLIRPTGPPSSGSGDPTAVPQPRAPPHPGTYCSTRSAARCARTVH